jgi:hypothetical protein
MLTLEDQGPIFIILDAIDECPNSAGTSSPRENVLELLELAIGITLFKPLFSRHQQAGNRVTGMQTTAVNFWAPSIATLAQCSPLPFLLTERF